VTVPDKDADLDSPSLASRIAGCFDFHWILFDALDSSAPRDSPRRQEHEAAVGRKIEGVVGGRRRQRRRAVGVRRGHHVYMCN
jgi:hypothetical protein